MTEPRELSYLVPADVLAEVRTAVTVLEAYGPAVTEALRQLDQATTVAWKAVNLVEVTDDEWQLVKRGDRDRPWLGCGLPAGLHPRPARVACRPPSGRPVSSTRPVDEVTLDDCALRD